MMLKKSSSPRVSNMEETVCLAMVSLRPFILPLTSTRMTTSFGEVAAWMYHFRLRQSKAMTPCSSGFHLIPWRQRVSIRVKYKQDTAIVLELHKFCERKTNCYFGWKRKKGARKSVLQALKACCQSTLLFLSQQNFSKTFIICFWKLPLPPTMLFLETQFTWITFFSFLVLSGHAHRDLRFLLPP